MRTSRGACLGFASCNQDSSCSQGGRKLQDGQLSKGLRGQRKSTACRQPDCLPIAQIHIQTLQINLQRGKSESSFWRSESTDKSDQASLSIFGGMEIRLKRIRALMIGRSWAANGSTLQERR